MTSPFMRNTSYHKSKRSAQQELIDEWKPVREVWSLHYGDKILGAISAFNGLLINQMFRRKLKLRHEGAIATSLCLAFGPGVSTIIGHKYFVTEDIVECRRNCAMCHEFRAVSIQCGTGIIHPMMLAPLLNIAIAGTIGYRIPYLYEVKELTKLCWSVIRPQLKTISFLFFSNIFVSGIITNSYVHIYNNMEPIMKYINFVHISQLSRLQLQIQTLMLWLR